MKHSHRIVIGDWSDDGHGKTETFEIKSNLSKKEIEKAYQEGSKLVGFDMIKDICDSYEDSEFPKESYEKLVSLGCKVKLTPYNGVISPDFDEWKELFLFVTFLGDKNFQWKDVKSSDIRIGGYGLFT